MSTASAALVRNTQKWSYSGNGGFSCGWLGRDSKRKEWGTQHENGQSTQFKFTLIKWLFRVGLAWGWGGEQDCCSLTVHGYLLIWNGLGDSHSPWKLDPKWRNGLHTRYGDLTDTWSFLFWSFLKHCFTYVPMAQQVGRANYFRNENLDSQRNLKPQKGDPWKQLRNCWSKETPIFSWKHTDLVRKLNSGTNCYITKTGLCQPGHCSRRLPGWCGLQNMGTVWAGLWHTNSSARSWKVPGLFYGRETIKIQGISKRKKSLPYPTITTKEWRERERHKHTHRWCSLK